jgi:hypothetical protein
VLGGGRYRPIFLLSALLRRQFTPLYTNSTRELDSIGCGRHPLEPNGAAHIIHQVHHADLHAGACHADGAHELAAHPVFLIPKHVFDANAHSGARGVGSLLPLGQRMVASAPTMDAALVALLLKPGFRLYRPVGAVGPHLVARVGFIQDLIELLAVVYRGIGLGVAPHNFVRAIDTNVVLVAIKVLLVLLGPARVLVFLGVLCRLFFPAIGRLAGFDRLVLFAVVVLLLALIASKRLSRS